ncbi:MAG: TonB-dependent receptor plug domain-containing protein [Pseudomonadota bacterium]
MTKRNARALTGVLAATLTAVPAFAQEVQAPAKAGSQQPQNNPDLPQAPAKKDAAPAALEVVVVTARRRSEKLQDVPLSVTNYSPDALAARRIGDRTDLANFTPSLISITGGYPKEFAFFALRGQGPAFGSTPGVVNYFAEVPNPIGVDGRVGTYFDLANVQVLAGPQGTLFGKNATGGNILFEPQRPTNKFGGYAQLEAGNLKNRRAEFALNVPMSDNRVLLRIAGERGVRDGYTKDVGPYFAGKDYDNLNYSSLRASLIVRPTENTELYTVARYYESDNNGPGTVLTQFNPTLGEPTTPAAAIFPGLAAVMPAQQARGPRRVSYDLDEFSKTRYAQFINHATLALGDSLKLKNIVSYSKFEMRYGYDYDATPFALGGQTSRTGMPTQAPTYLTEELQLQGDAFDNALNFTTGLYYDRQRLSESQGGIFTQFPLSLAIGNVPVRVDNTSESKAVFGQATLDLAKVGLPKGLSLTAGYRYTWESVANESQIWILPVAGGQADFEYGSYNFTLDHKVSENMHMYAAVRDAFKAGGVNGPVPVTSSYRTFAPEELKDVELGVKSEFKIGNMAARANLAIYHGKYTNIQRTGSEAIDGVVLNVTRSAAEGKIQGAELTGALVPVRGLTLTGSYSYTDGKYTKVADAGIGAILAGSTFPFTPKTKYALGVTWEQAQASLGTLVLSANYAHQSSFSTAQNNLARVQSLPAYGTLSLRAALRKIGGRPIDVSVYVANATNQTYASGLADFYSSLGSVTYTYGEPRTFGLQVRYAF